MKRVRTRIALLGVLAAVLGPIAACSDDGPKEGEARFEVDGEASVERQDGTRESVGDGTDVRVGDQITIISGSGRLELDDGTVLELREGIDDATDDTVLVMGPIPVLEAGDLLVIAEGVAELSAADTGVTIDDGAAKLSRNIGLVIAAYDADVHVDSAGQQRDVPPLREIQVAALGVPADAPRPFAVSSADPWDRRFLGAAIDLGDRLDAISAGFTQNLEQGAGRSVGFYRDVLPDLADEPELTAELIDPDRDPGETLVGAAIAQLGRRGEFAQRWASVFAFRDETASWGLVALDQGVDSGPLLDALDIAVSEAPLALGPTPSAPPSTPVPGEPPSEPGSPTTTAPPTTQPSSPPTSSPPATFPPDEPGPLEPILGPIYDPVAELLADLLGGLLGGLF